MVEVSKAKQSGVQDSTEEEEGIGLVGGSHTIQEEQMKRGNS